MTQSNYYSIGGLAEMSGVSTRTLRYYDRIGLLSPESVMPNGYRRYTTAESLRLQQILIYRELGFSLTKIKQMLDDPAFDITAAYESQLSALIDQRAQLERLINNIRASINAVKGETIMTDNERFIGLKKQAVAENEAAYGTEARRLYGDKAIDSASEQLLGMDEQQWNAHQSLEQEILRELAAAMREGDPSGELAKHLCLLHRQWIKDSWGNGTYSAEAHLCLARTYTTDERFRQYYDSAAGEGAADFLRAALEHFFK